MTRINVVPVEDLCRQHLQGELKEITRVFNLVRKAQDRGVNKWNIAQKLKNKPAAYTMGTGHVLFFYDKLMYVAKRYSALCAEMRSRGYKPNQIPQKDLLSGIDMHWLQDYTPTQQAIKINWQRINERLEAMNAT